MVDRHDADDAVRKSMERRSSTDEAVVVVMMVLADDVSLMLYRQSSGHDLGNVHGDCFCHCLARTVLQNKNQGFSSPAKLSRNRRRHLQNLPAEGLFTNSPYR